MNKRCLLADSVLMKIICSQLAGVENQLTVEEINTLAQEMEGYSGSDIVTVMADASMEPVRELMTAEYWQCERTADGTCAWKPCDSTALDALRGQLQDIPSQEVHPRPISAADVRTAIQANPRTVAQEELDRFAAYNQQK
eukprot:m.204279 g.204279  ORF g.204279 m.204279 type:complete len:140 (+) comp16884_c0_seq2:1103-1522(+)